MPSFCISLKELSVSDCVNITDFGLYELAKLGAALRYLSVAKCDRVSDAGLKVIARRCYKLRYLNTRGCEAVSDDSITVLIAISIFYTLINKNHFFNYSKLLVPVPV